MKKTLITFSILLVLAIAGAFWGGMFYANNQKSSDQSNRLGKNFVAPNGQQGQGNSRMNRGMGGFNNGEILSKDDKSITIKLRDGGSKIILYSSATNISKSSVGSAADLEIGKPVMVSGDANSDGSISAKTIQLNPITPAAPTDPQNSIPAKTN